MHAWRKQSNPNCMQCTVLVLLLSVLGRCMLWCWFCCCDTLATRAKVLPHLNLDLVLHACDVMPVGVLPPILVISLKTQSNHILNNYC